MRPCLTLLFYIEEGRMEVTVQNVSLKLKYERFIALGAVERMK